VVKSADAEGVLDGAAQPSDYGLTTEGADFIVATNEKLTAARTER
jgi:hypothetical protein